MFFRCINRINPVDPQIELLTTENAQLRAELVSLKASNTQLRDNWTSLVESDIEAIHFFETEFNRLHELHLTLLETQATLASTIKHVLSGFNDCLMCPISHALIDDPVIASDGHLYERKCIEDWIRVHRPPTSPMTNGCLQYFPLYPCFIITTLRRIIDEVYE